MKLVKFNVGNSAVEFVCTSRDTRHGFAHEAVMYANDYPWATGKCFYLNRTWESWTYQSACMTAVRNALDYEEARLRDDYKREQGITRVVGDKRKDELKAYIDSCKEVIFLREVMKTLKDKTF